MSQSEFYMQCEEEEFVPFESYVDGTKPLDLSSGAQNEDVAVPPAPPDGSPAVSQPALAVQSAEERGMKTTVLPIAAAPMADKQLLPSVLQPLQMTTSDIPDQVVRMASQAPPGTHQNVKTPVGFILPTSTGQSVTFLTSAQASLLLSSQLASPSGKPKATAAGNNTVRIPVNFTIRSPVGVQKVTAIASTGMPALGLSSSHVPLLSASEDSGAAEVASSPMQLPEVVTVPAAVSTLKAPAAVVTHTVSAASPVLSVPAKVFTASSQNSHQNLAATKPQAETSALRTVSTLVYQGASRPPQTCSVCGASYRVVQSLRGYMCQCNQELITDIKTMLVQTRKRKPRRVSHRSPSAPTSSSASASSRHPSASPPASVKHVTTSEIPEGTPSPGTGDYDQHGKLIILVEDFFYGRDPGHPILIENEQVPIIMKCQLCDKKLKNNIKLMNHMKHHMEMELQRGEMDGHNVCQHCFRNFSSPFTLQCHVETVHSQIESTAVCKICELSFENEPLFLNHMKNTHKPGEMPYICQVCDFRSSFYNDVIVHFRELHKDTHHLQCSYCLKVFKSSNGYQLHYSKHQKKNVLHCDKCRLQFLFPKDKADHKAFFHRTHLKPVQLLGLKPGTRVTIRAYTVTRVDDRSGFRAPGTNTQSPPAKEISPAHPKPIQKNHAHKILPTKRKPIESMLELMTKFQRQCEPASKRFCMECNFEIQDFSIHFPTFVHCSLCHYCTCCSRAYANHMISYHVSRKTTTKYLNLYKPCPKLGQLSCSLCNYTTEIGDLMARHVAANPGHCSSLCQFSEGFSRGYKRFVFIPTDLIRPDQRPNAKSFHVMQVDQHSLSNPSKPVTHPNQCVYLPAVSVHMPSIPVQVQPDDQSIVPDQNCGTEPKVSTPQNRGLCTRAQAKPAETVGRSLTLAQLKIAYYAICFGIPQASNHFDTQPEEVQSLLLKCKLQFGSSKRKEKLIPKATDRLAEWVLQQREQQLPLSEGKLFSKATEIISPNGRPEISYEWAVDFLLQHNLGPQTFATSLQLLPPQVQKHVRFFTQFITKQITTQCFGQSFIGAMDELSVFIDMEQLDPASADSSSLMSAFKLVGESDPLMDIVLIALADGTMLPAMVFLKGKPLRQDGPSLPDIVFLEAKAEGFSDEERLQLWFEKVWQRHVDPSSGRKALLIMDTYREHISKHFLASLKRANTLPGMVPHACSCHLQPLEACVGPVLREFLQARWSQYVMESPHNLIGAEPADLALLIAAWLFEMLDVLAAMPELLQRSFDKVLSPSTDTASAEFLKLVQILTETLISTLQGQENQETEFGKKSNTLEMTSPNPIPSPPANPQGLKKIFEKDSDLESFLGFEDAEMTDC